MPASPSSDTDKGYILMHEIEAHKDISQRELSQKTGLSLGTVNLLLQKMIKQGLIKMECIPANRVIYMLTPAGMAEKAVKTVRYIRNHYQIIQETIDMIQQKLAQFHQQYDVIYICEPENELANLMRTAVDAYQAKHPGRVVRIVANAQFVSKEDESEGKKYVILYLPGETSCIDKLGLPISSIPLFSMLEAAKP